MSYVNVYPTRINWENEPSINTPINETNLNKMDYALYEHDQTLANWDTTKANQSDLLLCVKTITYDTDTGEFVFTWQNGTTKTVDLNIEKIPVSFSMNAQGVITMTTDDGTQYTADVGSLIKTYSFTDSSVIDFTVTTDESGNKTVTADIVDGSITGTKLQPNYLADCTAAKTAAELAETGAEGSAEDSEAWAVGTRSGVPVPATDPTYNNNAKYWAEQAPSNSLATLTDTDINTPTDGQVLTYDNSSQKWVNADQAAGGGSKIVLTTSELSLIGQTATLTDGVTTLSAEIDNSGKATFEGVTITGNLTASASDGVNTATASLTVPYFGNYTAALSFFSATVTVTFPYSLGATCTITDGDTTLSADGSPMAFSIPNTGTWTATCTLDGASKTQSFVITTDGQTESHTFSYGTINLTYANEFRGLTISCVNGGTTIQKTAPVGVNSMVFYPPSTGTWTISGTYSGVPYTTTATVSSLSTAVSAVLQTTPDGRTVTPTDNIQKWLQCAGISGKSYTTLAEVLADSTTLLALLSDDNANDYLVRSKSWTTANGLVPTMTSNTTPSGSVIATSDAGLSTAYKVFDGDNSTFWGSETTTDAFIGYDFGANVTVSKFKILPRYQNNLRLKTFKIQSSSDNSTWNDVYSGVIPSASQSDWYEDTITSDNAKDKRYFRLLCVDTYGGNCSVLELQFYATTENAGLCDNSTAMTDIGANDYCATTLLGDATWRSAIVNSAYIESVLNTKVPTMTSNTTPSGEASASVGNANAYKAFDGSTSTYWDENYSTNQWIAYENTSSTVVNAVSILPALAGSTYRRIQNFKVEGYKDGNWETIYTGVAQKTSEANPQVFDFSNIESYTKHRLYVVDTYDGTYIGIISLQFYGR